LAANFAPNEYKFIDKFYGSKGSTIYLGWYVSNAKWSHKRHLCIGVPFLVIVLHIFSGLFQNAVKLRGTWGFIANHSSSSEDTPYIELKLST
jgi:hypothetical protein